MDNKIAKFPSPCGVRRVGDVIGNYFPDCRDNEFPSPCGVRRVGDESGRKQTLETGVSFRPLAG